MKNKMEIMSHKARHALMESGFPKNTAVIRFYDPNDGHGFARGKDYKPMDYEGICSHAFSVGIQDMDIEILTSSIRNFLRMDSLTAPLPA